MDVTDEALDSAAKGLERLHSAVRAVRRRLLQAPEGEVEPAVQEVLEEGRRQFEASMDDDFNTPGAIAALFETTREVNALLNRGTPLTQGSLQAIDDLYRRLAGDVLGILPASLEEETISGMTPDLIALLIETRSALRQAKQFALADQIRDRLAALGIQLQDGPQGTTWTLR
ncbi:MAG: hypothetical protein H5T71_03595 [Chloroflexi bacterium]|nr:hypothetical protein [Chloroflexota bacterium]